MESSWRTNRETFGMGGPIHADFFTGAPIDYLCVLNPPLHLGSGIMTHVAIGRRTTGGRRVVFGQLSLGYFKGLQATTIGINDPFWLIWPVDPD